MSNLSDFIAASGGVLEKDSTSGASQTIDFSASKVHVSDLDVALATYTFTNVDSTLVSRVDLLISNNYQTSNFINTTYNSVSKRVGSEESSPQGLFFKPDGRKMYVVGTSSDTVFEYDSEVASGTVSLPSSLEIPLSGIPLGLNKTAISIVTSDGGVSYQVVSTLGDIA